MRTIREMFLKILFISPELNSSIIFSMLVLSMTKKLNYFLRNFVRRERVSLVQYQSISFDSSEWFQMKSQQVPIFVVLLLPLIGLQSHSNSISEVSCSMLLKFITNLFDP